MFNIRFNEGGKTKVIINRNNNQQNLEELMGRIVWSLGNVIPGPENTTRIDDPMDDGAWEPAGALTEAYRYA